MGKAQEPTAEEIEFVFSRLDHLNDLEIKEEMEEQAGFPPRRDGRYWRRMRRYWAAAKKVLEEQGKVVQDPLLTEKRRKHEERLVDGLRALGRQTQQSDLPRYWDWSTGEPSRNPVEWMRTDLELPNTSPVRWLQKHLDVEDPIWCAHRKSGEALLKYRELCSELYGELVNEAKEVARKIGVPLMSRWTKPTASLTSAFVDTLHWAMGYHVSGWAINVQYTRVTKPYSEDIELFQLWFGGNHIGIGSESQLDQAETAHSKLCSTLGDWPLIQQVRDARRLYVELASTLERCIEIKAEQRVFLPGPCEICEAYGGLR